MKNYTFSVSVIVLVALLTACVPPAGEVDADALATAVAGTLAAAGAGAPESTSPPTAEEAPQTNPVGSCANTGQLNLAYVKDGNVWLWVEGGAKSQLTSTSDAQDVRISQDGCRIAYARAVANPLYDPNVEFPTDPTLNELWVVSSDGSGNQKLAGAEFFATLPSPPDNLGLGLYLFEWQPGTHTLAFSTQVLGFGLIPSTDIHLVDANTTSLTTLLPGGQGGEFFFSPDGQQIAFSTPTSVNVINVDGSNLRANLITFPFVLTYSEYAYYPPVHWSPTGNGLMVAVPPEDGLAAPVDGIYPETSLWFIPLDGTPAFEAGAIQTVWFVTQEVQFSPDNGRIAYIRQYGELEAGLMELVIALSDGSNESLEIEIREIMFGDWAPDNSQFIYYYTDPDLHLFLGNVNNANVAPISTLTAFVAASAEVEWVQDSTFILLLFGNAGAELSVMQTSGSGVVVDNFANPFVAFDVTH